MACLGGLDLPSLDVLGCYLASPAQVLRLQTSFGLFSAFALPPYLDLSLRSHLGMSSYFGCSYALQPRTVLGRSLPSWLYYWHLDLATCIQRGIPFTPLLPCYVCLAPSASLPSACSTWHLTGCCISECTRAMLPRSAHAVAAGALALKRFSSLLAVRIPVHPRELPSPHHLALALTPLMTLGTCQDPQEALLRSAALPARCVHSLTGTASYANRARHRHTCLAHLCVVTSPIHSTICSLASAPRPPCFPASVPRPLHLAHSHSLFRRASALCYAPYLIPCT